MEGSSLILVCEDFRGLCFVVVEGLTTEFWDVEGARGWDARLVVVPVVVVVVVVVTLLVTEAGFLTDFSGTSDFLRLTVLFRGAIVK